MPTTFAIRLFVAICLCGNLGISAWKQQPAKEADATPAAFLKGAGPIIADPEDGHLGKYSGSGEEADKPPSADEPRAASLEEAPSHLERGHTEEKKEEHEEKPESESGENKESHHVGRAVTIVLGGMMIISAIAFAMATSANVKLKKYTWCTLDNVICIFLAVMVFQAVDEGLVDSGVVHEDHIRVCSVLYALFALGAAIGISFLLRGVPAQLGVFAAASAHFVSFAFMHAASVQMEFNAEHFTHAVWVFVGILIAMPLIFAGSFFLKQHMGITADPELMEKIDDVENDAGAMAAAISWTYVVCFAIAGEFQNVEEAEESSYGERKMMLTYAIVISLMCGAYVVMTSGSEAQESSSYAGSRAKAFFSSFAAMCVAWAFLLWGKWLCHGHHYAETPVLGRVVFAMTTTVVGMVIIVGMAYGLPTHSSMSHKLHKVQILMLSIVGLLIGWSWEETFDASLESVAGEREEPEHVGHVKVMAMLVMLVIVLPVHLMHFKPLAMKIDEDAKNEDA